MKYELRENAVNELGLFDPFFESFMFGDTAANKMLDTDIEENEKDFEITINVPGINKEDIKLSVEDGYLNIKYDHKSNNTDKKHNFLRKERYSASYARSFYLGDVDSKNVEASLENGVLTIVVPKLEKEENVSYISIK